jgi:polyisoprenyl-phosphate glycosyltransferase
MEHCTVTRRFLMSRRTIDIITSAYNEEVCLPELYKRLKAVLDSEKNYRWRLIAIDNGSIDNSWKVLRQLAIRDKRILAIRMARNFNLDAALTCGLDLATADLAVIMCSDLQDPPEAIPDLLRRYEEGYEHVAVKITKRGQVPIIRRIASNIFYYVANRITNNLIPRSVSDFRLVTRPCYVAVRNLREQHRFMRGLFAWAGFRTSYVEIERPPRFAGESSFLNINIFKVSQWAFSGILSHTTAPLVWLSATGLLLSLISIISLVILSASWLIIGVPFAGFGSIVAAIACGFSLILFSIGIIAQYLALVVEEVKSRPLYIVAEDYNKNRN